MYLTRKPINVSDVIASPVGAKQSQEIASPACQPPRNDEQSFRSGASVLFLGTVRNHSEGREVLYLEYEAYEAIAERMIEESVKSAFEKWRLEDVKLLHRLGCVELGEIAVAIEVRSAHRDEAYQASRYLIEKIKHKVPIWKKEHFEDGTSEWSLCPSHVELRASA